MERPMKLGGSTDPKIRELWCLLEEATERVMARLGDGARVDRIVGIPFREEDHDLNDVARTAWRGLDRAGLTAGSLVVCVGPACAAGGLAPPEAPGPSTDRTRVQGFGLPDEITGEHWGAMAMVRLAAALQAPLLLLRPDLKPQPEDADIPGQGYAPCWIERMLGAVTQHGLDLALARFARHPLANPVESLMAFPVVTAIFGFRLRQPMPGVMAMSSGHARAILEARGEWPHQHGPYGFDLWTLALAVVGERAIAEVPLGLATFRHDHGRVKPIFRQATSALLAIAAEYEDTWIERAEPIAQPRLCGPVLEAVPPHQEIERADLMARLKAEFDHFDDTLFRELVPADVREAMERWSDGLTEGVEISASRWTELLGRFVTAYCAPGLFDREDTVDGLFPFFLARLLTFADEVEEVSRALEASRSRLDLRLHAAHGLAEKSIERQADMMSSDWPDLRRTWSEAVLAAGPYLPRVGAWEFVPHVEIVVPQEIQSETGESVWAHRLYQEQLDRYRQQFVHFVAEHLELGRTTDSGAILAGIHAFMQKVESALASGLIPHDLSVPSGAQALLEQIVCDLTDGTSFQLRPEAAKTILQRIPPRELLLHRDLGSVEELLRTMAPNHALGVAAWTDRRRYLDQVLDFLDAQATPEWFHVAQLQPTALDVGRLEHLDELRGTAALTRLAGRLALRTQSEGRGGALPTLWYLLRALKRVASMEVFSAIWQELAKQEDEFSGRLVSTIRGHWGRRVLSAHHAFENRQQRLVAKHLARLAELAVERDPTKGEAAALVAAAASVYHLSITLPDATFVPLSAWTWASHSHRGGTGPPTPLSSLVERDWATRDFLVAYLERSGQGDDDVVDSTIARLMAEGRESADLGEILLEVDVDADRLVAQQSRAEVPPAALLVRPVEGPILTPVPEHDWESRYVLNAGAVRLEGNTYVVYRAFGNDEVSRLGLAWTADGTHIDGRLDRPIFEPAHPSESAGCEDPRITVIEDRLYMLYTAYDGNLPQIAMASIEIGDFLARRFDAWHRHGLGFPGLANKDAALYPERIDGRYVLYHRLDPAMWISYLDELDCPWPRTGHKIVVGPRSGMMWDGIKIGAGAQPIKTTHGWLNIYHGVDYERTYRLGVLVTDLADPSRVLYQSPNPVLQPEFDFEIGKMNGDAFWVPHVVFTCGAVVARETDTATLDDEVLVYYGAADTAIGVAKARIGDLMPLA